MAGSLAALTYGRAADREPATGAIKEKKEKKGGAGRGHAGRAASPRQKGRRFGGREPEDQGYSAGGGFPVRCTTVGQGSEGTRHRARMEH